MENSVYLGLAALSIIYSLQLLMIALAAGTGVGINTIMAAKPGIGSLTKEKSEWIKDAW